MMSDELSDEEVAGRVRMLMRSDLDHEFVCVLGRDRIKKLSNELAASKAECERLRGEQVQVMRAYDPNCDEYHHAYQVEAMKSASRLVDSMQSLAEALGRDPEGHLPDCVDDVLGRIDSLEEKSDHLESELSDANTQLTALRAADEANRRAMGEAKRWFETALRQWNGYSSDAPHYDENGERCDLSEAKNPEGDVYRLATAALSALAARIGEVGK
jgi:hypothetical protein